MKGIILAGGSGTRLYPLTIVTSKQLLPVYDKPLIYYPLSVLMYAGIRDILVVSTPKNTPQFETLLGDGNAFGIRLSYAVQPQPGGLAQALLAGERFAGDDAVAVILGDNFFYGRGLQEKMKKAVKNAVSSRGATVFGYTVKDPKRYGVVEFDADGTAVSIEEKPENPKSNQCVSGLYFYDNRVMSFARTLKPGIRGELEITDLNRLYLKEKRLFVERLGKDFVWMDAGTSDSLAGTSEFVRANEIKNRRMIGCPEEIAYRCGWIHKDILLKSYDRLRAVEYGTYLKAVADGKVRPAEYDCGL